MEPTDLKELETRIEAYIVDLPELIAQMLYRQLNRARSTSMAQIDNRIRHLATEAKIEKSCSCSGKHSGDSPFTHWIAGDG